MWNPEVVKIPSGLVTHSYCEKNPILVNQHPIGFIIFFCCCCCLLNKVFIFSRAWVPLFGYIIVGIITFLKECTLCWAYKYLRVKAYTVCINTYGRLFIINPHLIFSFFWLDFDDNDGYEIQNVGFMLLFHSLK